MESFRLSALFFAAGAAAGTFVMLRIFQRFNEGEPFTRAVRRYAVLLVITAALVGTAIYLQSIERKQLPEATSAKIQQEQVKSKYLGNWKSLQGIAHIQIYENNSDFAKFSKGDVMPLNYRKKVSTTQARRCLARCHF